LSESRRILTAHLLNLILVLGTVVSPVAHYVWMANSAHYEIATRSPSTAGTSHHAHAAGSQFGPGQRVDGEKPVQIHCDYSTRIALSSAVWLPLRNSTTMDIPKELAKAATQEQTTIRFDYLLPQFRGPPPVA